MRARTWESVLPLQSSSSLILASISREGVSPLVVALFVIFVCTSFGCFYPAEVPTTIIRQACMRPAETYWRKGWDSNPRYPCRHAGFQDRCLKPLGHPSVFGRQRLSRGARPGKASNRMMLPLAANHRGGNPALLAECESQQARAQQHQACRDQCEKSVGDQIVVAHDTPATFDARPNLLKLSESPGLKEVMRLPRHT